jgi:quercetin dioxygenase-like cupin family protein
MTTKDSCWVLGDRYTFHLVSPALSVVEVESAEGHGPPPHIHGSEDETLFVLSGRLEVTKDDERFVAETGDFVLFPKGTLHTFRTVSAEGSRILVTLTPGKFAKLFKKIGVQSEAEAQDPAILEKSIQDLLLLADRYSLRIPPPPVI